MQFLFTCLLPFLQVLEMSSVNDTVCRCSGNTFSTTFYVPPNMINFLTISSKFDVTNAFVYGPLIGMLVLYIIAAMLLRREDKKDLIRVSCTVH